MNEPYICEEEMKLTCEFHALYTGFAPHIYLCGRPAKYITPGGPMGQKPQYVCGLHKNSADKLQARIGSGLKCKPLEVIK